MYIAPPSSQTKFRYRISIVDFTFILSSPFIALGLRGSQFLSAGDLPFHPSPTISYALLTSIITLPIYILFRVNEGLTHLFSARDALAILVSSLLAVAASIFVVFFLTRLDGVPRSVPLLHGMVLVFELLLYRLVLRRFHERDISKTRFSANLLHSNLLRRVFIIGLDHFALATVRLIEKQAPKTTEVVACFSLQGKFSGLRVSNIKIYSDINLLGQIIDEYQVHGILIDEIWVSDSSKFFNHDIFDYINLQCKIRGIATKTISDALNLVPINCPDKLTVPHTHIKELPRQSVYISVKRFLDVFCAAIFLILLGPLFIIAILITVFEVGSPTLFWQERLGRFGHAFRFYKIRTMKEPLDNFGNFVSDDKRLTKITGMLRKYRIDEIPQLINVIAGDMSGIGPRPLLPKDQPKNKHVRLLFRPGITGWAQVNGAELLTPDEKDALDCWYVYNCSLLLDVWIVWLTLCLLYKGVSRNEVKIAAAKDWLLNQKYFS